MLEQDPTPVIKDPNLITIENPSPQMMRNAIGTPYKQVGNRIMPKLPKFELSKPEDAAHTEVVEHAGEKAVEGLVEKPVGAQEFPGLFDTDFENTPEDAAVRTPEAEAAAKAGAAVINDKIRQEQEK